MLSPNEEYRKALAAKQWQSRRERLALWLTAPGMVLVIVVCCVAFAVLAIGGDLSCPAPACERDPVRCDQDPWTAEAARTKREVSIGGVALAGCQE